MSRIERRDLSHRACHVSCASEGEARPRAGKGDRHASHIAHSHTSSVIAERARALRAFPTLSELKLWQEGKRQGVAFRRQHPVGRYVADFAAPSVRLIVEVDGGYHARRARADARRDRARERAGWRVLRLEAELVMRRLPEAVGRVRAAVECVV